jgi:hypothetical protein
VRKEKAMAMKKSDVTPKRGQMVTPADAPDEPEDLVNHPPHYTQGAVECIEAIESALGRDGFIAFLRGTIMKYTWRLEDKDSPLEDAKKCEWYLKRLIEVLER